jgi:general secretion pathway protein M
MNAFWARLGSRDRRILIIGAVCLGVILPYWLVLQSLTEQAERMERSVSALYEDVAWMQAAAERVRGVEGGATGAPAAAGDGSPLSVIDRTAREGPLTGTVRRVQPEGADAVRVWLEDAPFDDLILWLGTLETRYGLRVTSLVVDRQPVEGRVNARLSLERAGGGQ